VKRMMRQTLLELAIAAIVIVGSAWLFLEHPAGAAVEPSTGVLVYAPPLPCAELYNEEEGVPDDGWLAGEF